MHSICNDNDFNDYRLYNNKCIKNENISFNKHKITFDDIYKKRQNLFYNVKKIPYGCIYDSIVYA